MEKAINFFCGNKRGKAGGGEETRGKQPYRRKGSLVLNDRDEMGHQKLAQGLGGKKGGKNTGTGNGRWVWWKRYGGKRTRTSNVES